MKIADKVAPRHKGLSVASMIQAAAKGQPECIKQAILDSPTCEKIAADALDRASLMGLPKRETFVQIRDYLRLFSMEAHLARK